MRKITLQKSILGFIFLWTTLSGFATPGPVTETVEQELQCSIEGTDVCCTGEKTGKAKVAVVGGRAPFTYSWDGGIADTDAEVGGLAAGTYTVTVTDCDGKQTTCSVTIAEPAPLACSVTKGNDASSTTSADGSATVYPTGGTAPYTYHWDNGETSQTATALGVGTHKVMVKDAAGCTTECTVVIECTVTEQEVCDGVDNDGDGDIDEGFDKDHDGIADCFDDCDDSIDSDGDGTPDCTDTCDDRIDSDGDGISDCVDTCDDTIDSDNDGISDCEDTCDDTIDSDNDGISDCEDTCDDRIDTDGDGISDCEDTCDDTIDSDNDGISDCVDTCDDRIDTDGDGISDCEDTCDDRIDTDGDGISDCEDTCDDRIDSDNDGISDCEDTCDDRIDSDNDGISDCEDTCDDNIDSDNDGISDCVDTCDDRIDTDGDGISDCEDTCDDTIDTDGDGISDCEDTCDDRIDTDGDGISDCEDTCDDTIDTDGDGISDCEDTCDDRIDSDGDGISDCEDTCDDTIDTDGDGISDCEDTCDDTIDTDGDGISDCEDTCDDTIDTDGDGISDCEDTCDDTIDTDGDGTPDCTDLCEGSNDTADSDNDGVPDGCDVEECDGVDNDGDGLVDEGLNCGGATGCETAYARAATEASCFLDYEDDRDRRLFNRWGWTNFLDTPGSYDMELWAAAGQCDTSKGQLTGTVSVSWSSQNQVVVSIAMNPGYILTEAQLYIGPDPFPTIDGEPTVAPGQYPYQDGQGTNPGIAGSGTTTYTFSPIDVSAFSSGFYVIFHGVTCGTQTARIALEQTLMVTPFPTVFEDEINLDIQVDTATKATVGVYGMNGAQLKAEQFQLSSGRNRVRMDLSNLSGAMYILEVQTPDGQKVLSKIMAR